MSARESKVKLYAMGFRAAIKRSTLANANELRHWHIWADLAAALIRRARMLYASESLGVELDNTFYALDSSTIDLCPSLFDWAPFRSTKAAIKLHMLLDLRGAASSICALYKSRRQSMPPRRRGSNCSSSGSSSAYASNISWAPARTQ